MSDEKRGVEKSLHDAGEDPDDPWPHEPDEFDPHSLGPGGNAGATDGERTRPEVDRETFRAFWGAVVMVNVGVFLVSVGPMLMYFRGQLALGAGMVLAGLGTFAHAYYTYRDYRERGAEDEDRSDGSEEGESSRTAEEGVSSGTAEAVGVAGATDTEDAARAVEEVEASRVADEVDAP